VAALLRLMLMKDSGLVDFLVAYPAKLAEQGLAAQVLLSEQEE